MKCPCRILSEESRNYTDCCEAIHNSLESAKTAEQLMRARYSAFVLKVFEFIESSHDPKTIGTTDINEAKKWSESAEWLGLEIMHTEKGLHKDSTGTVEFKANFDLGNGPEVHHEVSEFRKINK